MSIFSIHYMIKQANGPLYWGGGAPGDLDCWLEDGIRFFARDDAYKVRNGLLRSLHCTIEQAE